jgi:hypothetical protein
MTLEEAIEQIKSDSEKAGIALLDEDVLREAIQLMQAAAMAEIAYQLGGEKWPMSARTSRKAASS